MQSLLDLPLEEKAGFFNEKILTTAHLKADCLEGFKNQGVTRFVAPFYFPDCSRFVSNQTVNHRFVVQNHYISVVFL
jgi:hypothetical protein